MSESGVVYQDAFCMVRIDPKLRLASYVRNATRFPDLETARQTFHALGAVQLGDVDRLLSDVREAPGNNSPEWDALFEDLGRRFFARFRKRAAVVRSVVGRMQVERLAHAREASETFRVFYDDTAARRWLLE